LKAKKNALNRVNILLAASGEARMNQEMRVSATTPTHALLRRCAVVAMAITASLSSFVFLQARPVGASGFVQPANPASNVLPATPFNCAALNPPNSPNDTTTACTNSALYNIDVGRIAEGLGPLYLPTNWASLTLSEQNLAIVNLERTARGLPSEYGLVNCMNADAQTSSNTGNDPVNTCPAPYTGTGIPYRGNWANIGTALQADFYLVYDDGLGSANVECTLANQTGCWGHRENILNVLCNNITPCTYVMGAQSTGDTGQEFGVFPGASNPPLSDMSFLDSSITYATSAAPDILSLGALSGSSGATVTVNGIYFTGATSVQFGSPLCTAVPTVTNDVKLTVQVPVCALGSANITVVTPSGTSNASPFTAEHSDPYSTLTPTRICDTRAGNQSKLTGQAAQCNGGAGNPGSTLAAGGSKSITVAGQFNVPPDATAVVLNVTVVSPSAAGFVTVFPAGASMPLASNIDYVGGEVVPNLVEVGIGTNGQVSFYSSSRTDLVVDVEGYASPTPAAGIGSGLYSPLPAPVRICDTRAGDPSMLDVAPVNQCNGTNNTGTTLGAGGTRNVQVTGIGTGLGAIPAGAIGAVLNVTVANPGAPGYLTAYPQGGSPPTASNLDYGAGQVTANRVIVPLSAGGAITVYSSARADVIVDVSGYYSAPAISATGSQFNAEPAPVRICDTRVAAAHNQCSGRTIGAGQTLTVPVIGLAASGVPVGATAVVVNLTGIAPTQPTFLTVFPGPTRPAATSDLDPAVQEVRANLVVATLSHNGTISIYNLGGNIDVIVDVLGWYS
jgi:hypothetical protein